MRARHAATAPLALAAALLAVAGGCGGDPPAGGDAARPGSTADAGGSPIVAVAAQPCDRPTARRGVGVVLADGVVATAAHVVDGAVRALEAGGRPATPLVIDARRDLALLAADTTGLRPATLADRSVDPGTALTIGGPATSVAVDVLRTVTLEVDDATAGAVHRRRSYVVAPAVEAGASGAPLLDESGRVLGIVVLSRRSGAVSYVVTGDEVASLVAEHAAAPGALEVTPGCA